MTATDDIRRMLDELGVEHSDFASAYRLSTRWQDSSRRVIEHQLHKDNDIGDMGIVRNLTPKQAIAATLGGVRLTAEQVRAAIFNGSGYASFDGAKYYADGIGMQAIADELNATLGRGTCKVESMHGYTDAHTHTSWCVELSCHTLDAWEDSIPPSYCPICGRKVVE